MIGDFAGFGTVWYYSDGIANVLSLGLVSDTGAFTRIRCNSGVVKVYTIGDFAGFGAVWYYSDGISNVLSLGLVSDTMRITMDTATDNALFVHRNDGTLRRFGKSNNHGLYYSRVNCKDGCMFTVVTVKEKESQYSDLDVRRAKKARELQGTIGHPSSTSLITTSFRVVRSTTVTP